MARPVTLGRLFGKMREITGGLQPTDRVIVAGIQRVQPGAKVSVQLDATPTKQLALRGDRS
jgi:multidrug efflux pump subunit AcrA (membrane-fusion protein)